MQETRDKSSLALREWSFLQGGIWPEKRDLCESTPVLNMAHSGSEPRHLYCKITVKFAVVYWQLDFRLAKFT